MIEQSSQDILIAGGRVDHPARPPLPLPLLPPLLPPHQGRRHAASMLVTLIVTFLALFHGSYYDCDADTDSNHPQAGTHDALMTSQFQASLEGGLGSIIR